MRLSRYTQNALAQTRLRDNRAETHCSFNAGTTACLRHTKLCALGKNYRTLKVYFERDTQCVPLSNKELRKADIC